MRRIFLVVLLLLVPGLSGCLTSVQDGLDRLLIPGATVTHTPLLEDQWNTDGHVGLDIVHDEALWGGIAYREPEAEEWVTTHVSEDAAVRLADGRYETSVDVRIPDGTWEVRIIVEGRTWDRFHNVRIDTVPPSFTDLEKGGHAPDGDYLLGPQASISDGTLEVFNARGDVLGTAFPVSIDALDDGVHVFKVVATDEAGNQAVQFVQIIAGDATDLTPGDATFGIVSRYTILAELWDLDRADQYLKPHEAAALMPRYLGDGFGITPNDPAVQDVVDDVVQPHMTTMEAALALYEWLFDELEYDEERLASTTLMLPRHVILDTEDPDAETSADEDAGEDGLSDDGEGNGVRGGVCRDLAATYVSLLRAAGIPARLVTGYLAGTVNGFHAWVEVYVGALGSQPAWMPIDVSPIDGDWDENFGPTDKGPAIAMQAFGIRLPDYLPLRPLEPDEEIKGWPTAIGARYSYTGDAPEVTFHKRTVDDYKEWGVMCVDSQTYARALASHPSECTFGDVVYGWDGSEATFSVASVQVIDYGVIVEQRSDSASINMVVAYPFEEEIDPVLVEYLPYGSPDGTYPTRDGMIHATIDHE